MGGGAASVRDYDSRAQAPRGTMTTKRAISGRGQEVTEPEDNAAGPRVAADSVALELTGITCAACVARIDKVEGPARWPEDGFSPPVGGAPVLPDRYDY